MRERTLLINSIQLIEALLCADYVPGRDDWLFVLHDRLCRQLHSLERKPMVEFMPGHPAPDAAQRRRRD